MKRLFSALWICLLAACHSHDHGHDEPHGHGHGHDDDHGHGAESDRPSLTFTHWSGASELFIELPALVQGLDSPCAARVTQRPVAPAGALLLTERCAVWSAVR